MGKQERSHFWYKLFYSIAFTLTLVLGIAICMSIFANSTVNADMFEPSHYCSKPIKPYSFNDQWEYDQFLAEVEEFKACIDDFVQEQQDAIEVHQDAIEEAIDEWNNFVNYELE